jgi:hypothetical protein
LLVIPAKAGIQFLALEQTVTFQRCMEAVIDSKEETLDYTRLPSRTLRAIRCANVRSGILPPQSGFRRKDELKASDIGYLA